MKELENALIWQSHGKFSHNENKKLTIYHNFLGGPVVKTWCFNAGGEGSMLGQ